MPNGSTLIVVADRGQARFLSQADPAATLTEHTDLGMTIGQSASEPNRSVRARDRTGADRRARTYRPTSPEMAVYDFLADIADRIAETLQRERYSHLALGIPLVWKSAFKAALSPTARETLVLSLGKNVCGKSLADLDQRLRELRV